MKKLGLIVMPLMAISLLASCNQPTPTPSGNTYKLTFNCPNCKIFDEFDREITSTIDITAPSGYTTYRKFFLKGATGYHSPLGSTVSVNKTSSEEKIEDYAYKPKTGEIYLPINDNITITGQGINKTLEECSWDEINEISTTGRAEEFFDIYDPTKPELNCKKITLTVNGELQEFPHTVRIIGFNHDDLADGSGKAGITFEFMDVITDVNGSAITQNWDSSSNCDYRGSSLDAFLNDETKEAISVINMLPSDLTEEGIIKPVNKLVGINESGSKGDENYKAEPFGEDSRHRLFCLAYNEMHNLEETFSHVTPGEAGDSSTGAGIYEHYKGHDSDSPIDCDYRIKKAVGGNNAEKYWLRSPYTNNVTTAWSIYNRGSFIAQGISNEYAVAPAFCV